jgi:putative SOS response-associated peptidase YedK
MCNRARNKREPETLREDFHAKWWTPRPMDNRFNPVELVPRGRAYVLREVDGELGGDVMSWDVLGGGAAWPITNVRDLKRWKSLASKPENRCLIPVTEFAEWTPERHDRGDGKAAIKGEMWFSLVDQPVFAIAGFWQHLKDDARGFTMVTCDPNELVAPIHPKAMVTILDPADYETWLRGTYEEVVALQRPFPADHMTVRGPIFPTRTAK